MYVLNTTDKVFKVSITSTTVKPAECATVKISFKPQVPWQSYTEYYIIDDIAGNINRLTVTGRSSGTISLHYCPFFMK